MTNSDVIRDLLQGATGHTPNPTRVAWYVSVIGDVDAVSLEEACRRASQETKRAVASPQEILTALHSSAPQATPDAQRDERREMFRRVLEACEEGASWSYDEVVARPDLYSTTPLARRVAWCEVQARKPGLWGEMARLLLDRERRALDAARHLDAERERQRAQVDEWRSRIDAEPPPLEAAR